jgi:hypothetical protein
MMAGALSMMVAGAMAQPVQWRVQDGGNGHWYQAFVQNPITWSQSRAAARGMGGDLVSLNTAAENDWVYSMLASNLSLWNWRQGPWIGLHQDRSSPDYSEPSGGWRWVDGAPLTYSRWLSDHPYVDGGPCILADHANFGMWPSAPMNTWMANADEWYRACHVDANVSFIVEWSADCNADGIVDKGQIVSGQLTDLNENGIPDDCESIVDQMVQWRVEDGGNGHWYELVRHETGTVNWVYARRTAALRGGHLATFSGQAESDWVFERLVDRPDAWGGRWGPWIGLYQDRRLSSYSEPGGGWRWVTDEPLTFTRWQVGEPNNVGNSGEDHACLMAIGSCQQVRSPQWNDGPEYGDSTETCAPGTNGVVSFLVEYEGDCNANGVVDAIESRLGTVVDDNGDGVPDECEPGLAGFLQWSTTSGGNGHWYRVYVTDSEWEAEQAIALAQSLGGQLVSIGTAAEQHFIYQHLTSRYGPWATFLLGGVREATWQWLDGTPWSYQSWDSGICAAERGWGWWGQPDGSGTHLFASNCSGTLAWDDGECCVGAFIVEWSADCNADGLVDKGQILAGQLLDLDNNGIPDICETPCAFTTQPASTTIIPGADATFAAAFARAGHALRWRRNGVDLADSSRLSGTASPTLTIRQVASADQGVYDCVATGPCGSVASAVAELSCKATIDTQPQGGVFVGGQPVTLSVVAQGGTGATYRWRRDGVAIFNGVIHQGATTPTLTINLDEPSQSGSYSVAITNTCGTTISQGAWVEVTCPADFNDDGGTDGQDLFEFFEAWSGGLSSADLNFDGGTDGSDITAFFTRWENGC